jgi:hypothetical protein
MIMPVPPWEWFPLNVQSSMTSLVPLCRTKNAEPFPVETQSVMRQSRTVTLTPSCTRIAAPLFGK